MLLSLPIHQHGDGPSFTQVLDNAGAASRRQLQDLKLLRCLVQSKAGLMVELHTCNPPAQFVPIKISLPFSQGRVARDFVSQERKVLSIKKFVAVVMLMIHA